MGKFTEEKSLISVDNSFFSKIKRFWIKIFNRRRYEEEYVENVEVAVEESPKEETVKTRKLFDYDAEYTEEMSTKGSNNCENGVYDDILVNENNQAEVIQENEISVNPNGNDEIVYKTVEVDNDGGDMNTTFLFERKQKVNSVSEEREELERKLMNYYESIKPGI